MDYAQIPMQSIGPVKITGSELNTEVMVPLATFESTVWPSTNRGAKVTRLAGGITCTLIEDNMARSICIEAPDAATAADIKTMITQSEAQIEVVIATTSRFAKLTDIQVKQIGPLLYVRISIQSGDASGHNMVTKAADAVMLWLLETFPKLRYISVSGNACTDKKVSAVNAISGRGKSIVAEVLIPGELCKQRLHTSAQNIADLNIKKNLLGSIQAGSLMSANAHFANLLLATYLATGQDAANIVEGSQGITYAECRGEDLYFSVTVPNIIVGTVGHGKDHDFVRANLAQLGCTDNNAEPGVNSRKLAMIIAATILCGELSLMAALTNPGELMRAHHTFER